MNDIFSDPYLVFQIVITLSFTVFFMWQAWRAWQAIKR